MKKTLIALAALAAVGTASAQSSVTLSGIAKAGFASTTYSGSTAAAAAAAGQATSVADGSSRFFIMGVEDLGGGLKANFQIDTRFRFDESPAATQASGNTFVGLSGGFGGISIGKRDTHYCYGSDSHAVRATALQASSCGVLGFIGAAPIANASRSTNGIRYDLPSIAGISGYVSYLTAPFESDGALANSGAKGAAWAGQFTYANGPIKAGVSLWRAKNEARTTGQRAITWNAGYNFGAGTVGVTWDTSATQAYGVTATELKRNAWSIPVTFNVGAGTLLATYTRAQNVKDGAGTAVADSGATLISVGYDHPLSKRTSVGVNYTRLTNKDNANYNLYTQAALAGHTATAAGTKASQLYMGVRHAF